MTESLSDADVTVRLVVFFGVLLTLVIWEFAAPRRRQEIPRRLRWPNNLGLVAIDTILVRLLFPVVAVGFALMAEQNGWGLFNVVDLPEWLVLILSFLVLDLAIYLQHVMFHAVPAFWLFHRMHHADLEFDVTTGIRFHPVEILMSVALRLVVVAALGPPAIVVLLFEVVLNASSMFNHSNIYIPKSADRLLRGIIVTPDMHRVHHSIVPEETNSNFGFNLPWWDHLFGTYQAQPIAGHEGMTIGLTQFRSHRDLWLDRMILQPLRGQTGDRRIGRPTDTDSTHKDLSHVGWAAGVATILSFVSCYGTVAVIAILGAFGVSIVLNETVWAAAIVLFAGLAVLGIAFGSFRHGRYWPLAMAISGAAALVFAMYVRYSVVIEMSGFALLIGAAVADWRLRRSSRSQYVGR